MIVEIQTIHEVIPIHIFFSLGWGLGLMLEEEKVAIREITKL